MIRDERLKSTYDMINNYCNSYSILKVNYNHIKSLINELEEKKENVFISAYNIDFTIEELKVQKRIYGKAIRKLKRGITHEQKK